MPPKAINGRKNNTQTRQNGSAGTHKPSTPTSSSSPYQIRYIPPSTPPGYIFYPMVLYPDVKGSPQMMAMSPKERKGSSPKSPALTVGVQTTHYVVAIPQTQMEPQSSLYGVQVYTDSPAVRSWEELVRSDATEVQSWLCVAMSLMKELGTPVELSIAYRVGVAWLKAAEHAFFCEDAVSFLDKAFTYLNAAKMYPGAVPALTFASSLQQNSAAKMSVSKTRKSILFHGKNSRPVEEQFLTFWNCAYTPDTAHALINVLQNSQQYELAGQYYEELAAKTEDISERILYLGHATTMYKQQEKCKERYINCSTRLATIYAEQEDFTASGDVYFKLAEFTEQPDMWKLAISAYPEDNKPKLLSCWRRLADCYKSQSSKEGYEEALYNLAKLSQDINDWQHLAKNCSKVTYADEASQWLTAFTASSFAAIGNLFRKKSHEAVDVASAQGFHEKAIFNYSQAGDHKAMQSCKEEFTTRHKTSSPAMKPQEVDQFLKGFTETLKPKTPPIGSPMNKGHEESQSSNHNSSTLFYTPFLLSSS